MAPKTIINGPTQLVFLDIKLDLGMSMSLEHFLTKIIERKKNIVSYLEKANKINNPIACWIVFYKLLTSSKSQ